MKSIATRSMLVLLVVLAVVGTILLVRPASISSVTAAPIDSSTQSIFAQGDVPLGSLVQMTPIVMSPAPDSIAKANSSNLLEQGTVRLTNISGKNAVLLCVGWSRGDPAYNKEKCGPQGGKYGTYYRVGTPGSYIYPLRAGETKSFSATIAKSNESLPLRAFIDVIMFEDGTVWGKNSFRTTENFVNNLTLRRTMAAGFLMMLEKDGVEKVKEVYQGILAGKGEDDKYYHPRWLGR